MIKEPPATQPIDGFLIRGNLIFDRAARAIGIDESLARLVLAQALQQSGGNPSSATLEQLGTLPRRVGKLLTHLMPPDLAAQGERSLLLHLREWSAR
jgi:hypothetical protein